MSNDGHLDPNLKQIKKTGGKYVFVKRISYFSAVVDVNLKKHSVCIHGKKVALMITLIEFQ